MTLIDYYTRIEQEEYTQAVRLASYLMEKYRPKQVIDIGCMEREA